MPQNQPQNQKNIVLPDGHLELVDRDYTCACSFCVIMSTANNDIDGMPRITPDGRSWASDKSIKRHVRDNVTPELLDKFGIPRENGLIFESEFRGLQIEDRVEAARKALKMVSDVLLSLRTWIDARWFGFMPLGGKDILEGDDAEDSDFGRTSTVRGAVQVDIPLTINAVDIIESGCSKSWPLRKEHLTNRQGDLAPGAIKVITFGLYFFMMHVKAELAQKNGVTKADLELLKFIIPRMFDRRSADKSGIYMTQAWWAEHNAAYQTFSAFEFMRAARPKPLVEIATPAKSCDDYVFPTLEEIQKVIGKNGTVINLL